MKTKHKRFDLNSSVFENLNGNCNTIFSEKILGRVSLLKDVFSFKDFEEKMLLLLLCWEIRGSQKVLSECGRDTLTVYDVCGFLDMKPEDLINYISDSSPLLRFGILEPLKEHHPFIYTPLLLEQSVIKFLLGDVSIDSHIKPFIKVIPPLSSVKTDEEILKEKRVLFKLYGDKGRKLSYALELSSGGEYGLFCVSPEIFFEKDFYVLLKKLLRDSFLNGCNTYFSDFQRVLEKKGEGILHKLNELLKDFSWLVFLDLEERIDFEAEGFYTVERFFFSDKQGKRKKTQLDRFAKKLNLKYRLEDIVLPEENKNYLLEIINHSTYNESVFKNWGFEETFPYRGISVLFTGHPGTGKTMAASILGKEIGLDVYRIDLSKVVSKYIGETEKNISEIFEVYKETEGILFFDEADAIFGKRTEIKESHDRYSNIEISFLLQKIEDFDGIVILATNYKRNIDEAFLRRMRFVLDFPFPDENLRYEIWLKAFPNKCPVSENIDFRKLARDFKLSGANIKNAALYSAFFAVKEKSKIELKHVLEGIRFEMKKLGKSFQPAKISDNEEERW